MSTFYLKKLFSCAVYTYKEYRAFKISTLIFFVLFLLGVFSIVYNAVSKKQPPFYRDALFLLFLTYYFSDTVVGVICINSTTKWNFSAELMYSINLLRFALLCITYAGVCAVDYFKYLKSVKNKTNLHDSKKENLCKQQNLNLAFCKNGESVYKLKEYPCNKNENLVDINVSYILSLIDEILKREVTLDDKIWLEDLAQFIKHSYFLSPTKVKDFNERLETLVKKMTEYNVLW